MPERKTGDLLFKLTLNLSPEPLTTEMIPKIDPDILNPHRQRWVLKRNVELVGLEPVSLSGGKFGVTAGGITAETVLYLRGPGPWFQDISSFPCEKEPVSWFATREGSRVAGEDAARRWHDILKKREGALPSALAKVRTASAKESIESARIVAKLWLAEAEREWHEQEELQLHERRAEWKFYWDAAQARKLCKVPSRAAREVPTWSSMMEPPREIPEPSEGMTPLPSKLLARAPARRWNGLYSVRLSVDIAGKRLVGQFLIDSEAEKSLMSPYWLQNQGIDPRIVEIATLPPERVNWSGNQGLARRGVVDHVELAGYPLPMTQFLLVDTDLFAPPESVGVCCDGILGADFLRRFAVQFDPRTPPGVNLWAPEGFSLGKTPWVEVATVPLGKGQALVSSCSVESRTLRIPGVQWDTGSDVALSIHLPWYAYARKAEDPWRLRCDSLILADGLNEDLAPFDKSDAPETLKSRYPGVSVGMPVLTRGMFAFDLPHGRLWFDRKALSKTVPSNDSGLELRYAFKNGERVLEVARIDPKGPARHLLKEGMQVNTRITQLDAREAGDMDLWEVEQRLAGEYGEKLLIKWKSPKGTRSSMIKLR